MSRVIDFRVRPPRGSYQRFVDIFTPETLEEFGFDTLVYEGSVATKRYDDFVAELDAAGVVKAVIPGRGGAFGLSVDEQELADIVALDPDRYLAFPIVDAVADDAAEQVSHLIASGLATGVTLEPTIPVPGSATSAFDDRRAYRTYELLQAEHVPVLLTYSAHALERIDSRTAQQLDRVAADFPDLTIVVAHAGWPWTLECIAVAWHRPNVYLAPDVYATGGPGAEDYKAAARTILEDKMIFNSAYPGSPVNQAVELVRRTWGLDDEALDKLLYANAARVLGLEVGD